jgi:hypothetical protein
MFYGVNGARITPLSRFFRGDLSQFSKKPQKNLRKFIFILPEKEPVHFHFMLTVKTAEPESKALRASIQKSGIRVILRLKF